MKCRIHICSWFSCFMLFWCLVMLFLVMLCCFGVQSCYVVLALLFWCPVTLCCFGVCNGKKGMSAAHWWPTSVSETLCRTSLYSSSFSGSSNTCGNSFCSGMCLFKVPLLTLTDHAPNNYDQRIIMMTFTTRHSTPSYHFRGRDFCNFTCLLKTDHEMLRKYALNSSNRNEQ